MDMKQYRLLRLKIVGITLCFSLIPLLVLGTFFHYQFSRSYSDKIVTTLRTIVDDKRKQIDMFLEEKISQLRTVAFATDYEDARDDQYLSHLFNVMQSSSKSFIDLGVIDGNGDHVAYVGPYPLKTFNYRNEHWFQEVMLRGVYISDVFMGFRKFPHFIIAVLRRDGNRTWILRATIDSDIFDTLVRSVQVGKNGDAFLVNADNVLQTNSRFSGPVLAGVDMPSVVPFGNVRIDQAATVSGMPRIVGMSWLQHTKWLLVVQEDPAEEMSLLVRTQSIVLALILGGFALICSGAWLTTTTLIRKMITADREKAALDATLMQSSKMAALGKLAAGVAHEINNPLTLIRESAGWIKDLLADEDPEKLANFEEIEKAANKIEQHVDRARSVTHRLLGFGRRMEPTQEDVDLNMVVEQTVQFLENEAMHRNIRIDRRFDRVPHVTTDTAQVQQVILNVIENAIDAIDKDGEIVIRTGVNGPRHEAFIAISDNGPGIPKEIRDRIFDPFFTTKKVGEGTGLGLAIIYSILEKLGGRIDVESEVGTGSTFTIYLPAQ